MPSAATTMSSLSLKRPISIRGTSVRCAASVAPVIRPTSSIPQLLAAAAAALTLATAPVAMAAVRLPPIDSDPLRCERAFTGNTIGQANGVSDRVLDLRQCKLTGADLSGKTLSGALASDADFSNTNMQEVIMSKAYFVNSNIEGSNLQNAVVDRVDFSGANLKNTRFINAVVTGTYFTNADLGGSVWEDALIGSEDVKRLCENKTLVGESRDQVGCRVVRGAK